MRSARVFPGTILFVCGVALVAAAVNSSGAGQRPTSAEIRDVDGQPLNPFSPSGVASVIVFVATDCPISNSYAPEIQRVCQDYAARGVNCSLMYEDVDLPGAHLDESVRKHLQEYRYSGIAAAVDRSRIIAKRAKATVTPEAVVVDRAGKVRYRGRIDNLYAALGQSRRQVTEHDLRDALDAVIAGHSVPKSETEALGCFIVDPSTLRK
jgi:thiol-disulfide isomerase/thioredoxin